ncbi:hypothetical protein YC2023_037140 [Brassica napus]
MVMEVVVVKEWCGWRIWKCGEGDSAGDGGGSLHIGHPGFYRKWYNQVYHMLKVPYGAKERVQSNYICKALLFNCQILR